MDSNSIFEVIKKNDTATLKQLLSNGVNPNQSNNDGIVPLHLAASIGAIECLELLLKQVSTVIKYSITSKLKHKIKMEIPLYIMLPKRLIWKLYPYYWVLEPTPMQ